MTDRRIKMLGIDFDSLSMREVIDQLYSWMKSSDGACRYVVPTNVDGVILFSESPPLQAVYASAAMVLADGAPIVAASRWFGKHLPGRVAGSDLVPKIFAATEEYGDLKVFLLGAAPGVADRAIANIEKTWPRVKVVGFDSPPFGFEKSESESERIVKLIESAQPDLLLLGLGAPKQELWIYSHRDRVRAPVAICVGATIDFLAGDKKRAPVWMRKTGLEWGYRLMMEPRRLLRRYARDAWIFPQLLWRERSASRGNAGLAVGE